MGRFVWTPDRDRALREALDSSSSDEEAAAKLVKRYGASLSADAVRMRRCSLKIPSYTAKARGGATAYSSHGRFAWSPDRDAALRAALESCDTDREAAEILSDKFGVPISTSGVQSRRVRLGIPATRGRIEQRETGGRAAQVDDYPEITIDVDESEVSEARYVPETRYETEMGPPAAPPVASTDEEAEERVFEILSRLTKRGTAKLEDVCDALDLSPKATRVWIDAARDRGYRFDIDGADVGRRPHDDPTPSMPTEVPVQQAGSSHLVAAVGDIHFGSRHHVGSYFQDFCGTAYERGVRTFLHVGDLLDGVYRHSQWEQSARGFEEQVSVAIEQLPQWRDAQWFWILGNHDETLGEQSGLDVGRAVDQSFRAAGRNDLHYLGARGAYLRLLAPGEKRGLLVEIWHPRDRANAYAKSYRLQKKVEKYAPGTKPDVLIAGHWHTSMYLPVRAVHCIAAGCWQGGQSSFGKSLGGAPDIGSWILEYALTEHGTVRRFSQEWFAYYEREQVREIGLT